MIEMCLVLYDCVSSTERKMAGSPDAKEAKHLDMFSRAIRKGNCANCLGPPYQQINRNLALALVIEMEPKWFKDALITVLLGGVFCYNSIGTRFRI